MTGRPIEPRAEADRRVLSLLGLARRAGRLAVGTRAVREGVRKGTLKLVVLAADASPNARSRLEGVVARCGTPMVLCANRARLGAALGRGATAAVGVTDAGLAGRISAALEPAGGAGAGRREGSSPS